MSLNWPDKDPDEVLDYCLDWSDRLGSSDTISTSTWIVPTGIVADRRIRIRTPRLRFGCRRVWRGADMTF